MTSTLHVADHPRTPGNLLLTTSNGNTTLSWSRPPNIPGSVNVTYLVNIYSTESNATYLSLILTDTSYTLSDKTVEYCGTFNFYVIASNDAGSSNTATLKETIPLCKQRNNWGE